MLYKGGWSAKRGNKDASIHERECKKKLNGKKKKKDPLRGERSIERGSQAEESEERSLNFCVCIDRVNAEERGRKHGEEPSMRNNTHKRIQLVEKRVHPRYLGFPVGRNFEAS